MALESHLTSSRWRWRNGGGGWQSHLRYVLHVSYHMYPIRQSPILTLSIIAASVILIIVHHIRHPIIPSTRSIYWNTGILEYWKIHSEFRIVHYWRRSPTYCWLHDDITTPARPSIHPPGHEEETWHATPLWPTPIEYLYRQPNTTWTYFHHPSISPKSYWTRLRSVGSPVSSHMYCSSVIPIPLPQIKRHELAWVHTTFKKEGVKLNIPNPPTTLLCPNPLLPPLPPPGLWVVGLFRSGWPVCLCLIYSSQAGIPAIIHIKYSTR